MSVQNKSCKVVPDRNRDLLPWRNFPRFVKTHHGNEFEFLLSRLDELLDLAHIKDALNVAGIRVLFRNVDPLLKGRLCADSTRTSVVGGSVRQC